MPIEIQRFAPRRRPTRHPYEEWLCGKILQLELGVDFDQTPQVVATNIRSYARRRNIAVIVRPVRDYDSSGSPFRFVQVWGDLARTAADGPPEAIRALV